MNLLLIRHGQSEGDILDLNEGRADYSLTDLGEKEAQALAEYVKANYDVDKIYASPLRRAAGTAEALAKETNCNIIYDERLQEYNNGDLAGFTREEAAKRYPKLELAENESAYGMESDAEFRTRVENVFNTIIEDSLEVESVNTVAIITHGGVINQLYRTMLGLPIKGQQLFGTGDTGIHLWSVSREGIVVVKANMMEHISAELKAESDKKLRVAYFAGGCFWCMTPIFKIYGAKKVVCGYSGGDEVCPAYEDVKKQKTGHREAMAVEYDPEKTSYEMMLDIYLANVDPYDEGGQFIDRGHSYTLAAYYTCEQEKTLIEAKIAQMEAESQKKVHIAVEPLINFYEAETYHQDYYLKNPEAFEKELVESGRKKQ